MVRLRNMKPKPHCANHGFTLVELSIVILIIALLSGGVMVGANLLHAAKLRTIMEDKALYQGAVEAFYEKYRALPGDMTNATDFWGAEDDDYGTCAALLTASTTKATCNGNGDEHIWGDDGSGNFGVGHERFRAWQHLANAGLIEGSFSGVNACGSGTNSCYTAGVNTPLTQFHEGVWVLFDAGFQTEGFWDFRYDENPLTKLEYKHILVLGKRNSTAGTPWDALLMPKDAWSLDDKFDDGLPGSGDIMTVEPGPLFGGDGADYCATTDDPATAVYNVESQTHECLLIFHLPF